MWRRALLPKRSPGKYFSSSSSQYSFLDPHLFSISREVTPPKSSNTGYQSLLTQEQLSSIEATLHLAIRSNDIDQAWKCFRELMNYSSFLLSKSSCSTNSLIVSLSLNGSPINLRRAFACSLYFIEKNPSALKFETVRAFLGAIRDANMATPAFKLIDSMLANRYFMPYALWGDLLIEITEKNGRAVSFLKIFEDCCRIALEEKMEHMIPGMNGFKLALAACCHKLGSITDAESVVEKMSVFGMRPDQHIVGSLGFLYASKGMKRKVVELNNMLDTFNFPSRSYFFCNLISGYMKSGDISSVSETILSSLRHQTGENSNFSDDLYADIVNGFLKHGSVKDLANLIIMSQELEPESIDFTKSVGCGIISSCVRLGMLDKAHSIVDEMDAADKTVKIGVYTPILSAYCKDYRTAEATKLVMKISNRGLLLDMKNYEALIEASMAGQDFHSAFALFRDMREAKLEDLKGSYLTIMTGLMENQRPELMAAFLDDVVDDPRIEVKTHDWNSIIHAFCKAGRLEDGKRTFRRMVFLRYEPNAQTYLSLINGYVSAEKYFSVLMLWHDLKRHVEREGVAFDTTLVDALLYALVKGGFFDAAMEVVESAQRMRVFVDKWRYKQAFMETHKKLKVSKVRKKSIRKFEALIAFKNWVGLST